MSEQDVKPVKASQLKAGTYIVHENEVLKVIDTSTSKSGKHGHAKVRVSASNIETGSKKSLVFPGDDKLKSPIIEKPVCQVLAINPDSVQLMNTESYEVFEVPIPNYDEIGGELQSGDSIDLWQFMGRRIIKRKRPAES